MTNHRVLSVLAMINCKLTALQKRTKGVEIFFFFFFLSLTTQYDFFSRPPVSFSFCFSSKVVLFCFVLLFASIHPKLLRQGS